MAKRSKNLYESNFSKGKKLQEGNPVSSTLPDFLDSMLQDFAQAYGYFDYGDIMKYQPNEASLELLKKIYIQYQEEAEYDDEEAIDELAHKAANVLRGLPVDDSGWGDTRYLNGCCSDCGRGPKDDVRVATIETFMKESGFDVEEACDWLESDPLEQICEDCWEACKDMLNDHFQKSEYNDFGYDTRTGEKWGIDPETGKEWGAEFTESIDLKATMDYISKEIKDFFSRSKNMDIDMDTLQSADSVAKTLYLKLKAKGLLTMLEYDEEEKELFVKIGNGVEQSLKQYLLKQFKNSNKVLKKIDRSYKRTNTFRVVSKATGREYYPSVGFPKYENPDLVVNNTPRPDYIQKVVACIVKLAMRDYREAEEEKEKAATATEVRKDLKKAYFPEDRKASKKMSEALHGNGGWPYDPDDVVLDDDTDILIGIRYDAYPKHIQDIIIAQPGDGFCEWDEDGYAILPKDIQKEMDELDAKYEEAIKEFDGIVDVDDGDGESGMITPVETGLYCMKYGKFLKMCQIKGFDPEIFDIYTKNYIEM